MGRLILMDQLAGPGQVLNLCLNHVGDQPLHKYRDKYSATCTSQRKPNGLVYWIVVLLILVEQPGANQNHNYSYRYYDRIPHHIVYNFSGGYCEDFFIQFPVFVIALADFAITLPILVNQYAVFRIHPLSFTTVFFSAGISEKYISVYL